MNEAMLTDLCDKVGKLYKLGESTAIYWLLHKKFEDARNEALEEAASRADFWMKINKRSSQNGGPGAAIRALKGKTND